jgi:hypothetical protein
VDIAGSSAASQFDPSINTTRLAESIKLYYNVSSNSSTGSGCAGQTALVDLGSSSSNSTGFADQWAWAQSAVLWSVATTENFTDDSLRSFAASLNFSSLTKRTASNAAFELESNGFIYDFAAEQVIAPARSWVGTDPAVLNETSVKSALDRRTAMAVAASTQRSLALQHYWTDTLGMDSSTLDAFVEGVLGAPVLVPVDVTAKVGEVAMMDLAQVEGTDTPFPPPLGCYPGLSSGVLKEIDAVEVDVFGLDPVAKTNLSSSINKTCLAVRPVYGMLNVANLRTPFVDSDPRATWLAGQAVVVNSGDVKNRMTVHAGEVLVAGVNGTAGASSRSAPAAGTRYGTAGAIDHVLLDWLDLFPSPQAARNMAIYVLSATNTTTTNTTSEGDEPFGGAAADTPVLEVEIWGGVRFSDVNCTISNLGVFGKPAGESFREWTLQKAGKTASKGSSLPYVIWAANATATSVVRDTNLTNAAFERVWKKAGGLNATNTTGTGILAGWLTAAGLLSR